MQADMPTDRQSCDDTGVRLEEMPLGYVWELCEMSLGHLNLYLNDTPLVSQSHSINTPVASQVVFPMESQWHPNAAPVTSQWHVTTMNRDTHINLHLDRHVSINTNLEHSYW